MEKKITLPLTRELARTLKAGDSVLLTGTIYTSRDAGHKRMCEALARGEKLPFDPTICGTCLLWCSTGPAGTSSSWRTCWATAASRPPASTW